jgi:quinohemoprotein amine dehydrogenase alpha subunit
MKRQKVCCAVLFALLASLVFGTLAVAKTPFVEFGVVRQKCSVCHRLDNQGRVEVIEETRKTPEEWMNVVSRMIRINGAPINDNEFHAVIKELSQHLIVTPKEMAQVAYYTSEENSQFRERSSLMKTKTEERIFMACVRCHAYGKILSHKKTKDQWVENMQMHLGYYPTVVPQMREMNWPKEAMELADVLAEMCPRDTPEFDAWMKNRKEQDLAGEWKVAGYQPGLGYYDGTYTFTANTKMGEDEYIVRRAVRYENGTTLQQEGVGTLYGEYHLRYALAASPLVGRVEGVFNLDAAKQGFTGKWWTVVQDTNAYGNEAFYRSTGSPRVFAVFPQAVQATGKGQFVTMIGVNLPSGIDAGDLSFANPNVKVSKLQKMGDAKLVAEVLASTNAPLGPSAVKIEGVACGESLIVYDNLDGITILPALGRARVSSGAAYPPHGVQFVARGVHYGPDGQADTADDMILEPVKAEWWLEEESTRENDDDLKYLETSILNGLYVPVTTFAPIESRVQRREGIGLIAVGASYTEGGKKMKARALLGVTDPDFVTHIK